MPCKTLPEPDTTPLITALESLPQSDRESARATLHQAIDAIFLAEQPGVLVRGVITALLAFSFATSTGLLQLVLPLEVKGKARPRLGGYRGGKRAIMPEDYIAWINDAKWHFFEQWHNKAPLQQVHRLVVRFIGCDRKTDADNAAGSVMDALVGAGVLREDNMTVIPWLDARWEPGVKGTAPRIEILLDPAEKPHVKFLSKPKRVNTGKAVATTKPTAVRGTAQPTTGKKPRFVATVIEPDNSS